MKKLSEMIEGLMLFLIGVYAILLVFFGDYWQFLNPKFKGLTAVAAIFFIIIGIISVIRSRSQAKFSRVLIFLLLFRIMYLADAGISLTGHHLSGPQPKEKPRVTVNNIEYVKINLAELFSLCLKSQSNTLPLRYVARGMVVHNKKLGNLCQFGVVRNTIFCCLADSVCMCFRVQCDPKIDLKDGQWVAVYGTVERMPKKLPDPYINVKEMNMTVTNETYMLKADQVTVINAPEIPYIIDIRKAEPYAY